MAIQVMTVAEFKAQFSRIVDRGTPVIIRRRKLPVGYWQPLKPEELQARAEDLLRGFVNLGASLKRDIARRHDAYLYGRDA